MSGRAPLPDAVRLLSFEDESRLFVKLRATLAWETIRSMLSDARLRLSLVVLLSGMFWAALYGLFVEGFGFLDALHAEVISLLFNAFFASLMVMLVTLAAQTPLTPAMTVVILMLLARTSRKVFF